MECYGTHPKVVADNTLRAQELADVNLSEMMTMVEEAIEKVVNSIMHDMADWVMAEEVREVESLDQQGERYVAHKMVLSSIKTYQEPMEELRRRLDGLKKPEEWQLVQGKWSRKKIAILSLMGGAPSVPLGGALERPGFGSPSIVAEVPLVEEVKATVFSMDGESASGPDGFSSTFFTTAWEVIGHHVVVAVQEFFIRAYLPVGFSSTLIALIPKVLNPATFTDFRPISLYNVLMASEMFSAISKKVRGSNVALKLDMSKAYDRVSWIFLLRVLRAFGFSEVWIDMQNTSISPYFVARRCLLITHLAYADDVIIFTKGDQWSLRCVMQVLEEVLEDYQASSGQLLNNSKSCFFMSPKATEAHKNHVHKVTGFSFKEFPIRYLGCLIFVGRKKNSLFTHLIEAMGSRIQQWNRSWLSIGGRVVLIKSVLSMLPVYLLSMLAPPKGVIRQLEKNFADFLWEETCEGRRFRRKETLWASFLHARYCSVLQPNQVELAPSASYIWKRMSFGIEVPRASYFGDGSGFLGNGLMGFTPYQAVGSAGNLLFAWGILNVSNLTLRWLLQVALSAIFWFIWHARNKARFEGVAMDWRRLTFQINVELVLMLRAKANVPPGVGFAKLNTDGSAKDNPRLSGGGGVLRDSKRDILFAFAEFYGEVSTLQAESRALCMRLELCVLNGVSRIMVEVDSKALWAILVSEAASPLSICAVIQKIRSLLCVVHSINHCFREGNMVADSLASLATPSSPLRAYYSLKSFPTRSKGLVHLDKLGLCNFRVRRG
ncbi:uncharacterized protein [Coffea arabica]|uniref:RNase H type-1 domain-containing protein n=1 Tax=Coffea arabica TaxID=13443 RepID=A0ABM4UR01_COFAR